MELEELRKKINSIDTEIADLFIKRMNISEQIGIEKQKTGKAIYDPKRESEIIKGLTENAPSDLKKDITVLYKTIFAISKEHQNRLKTAEYGLIGIPLEHSYSKQIHENFNNYKYDIIPLNPEELDIFFEKRNFKFINVTIPYKETAIKYCKDISSLSEEIGSINTIVKDKNGDLHGYNTDYFGFMYCAEKADINFENKNVVILGTGGTSKTAQIAVKHGNCKSSTVVSRTGEINYTNIYEKCCNAQIIVNATPVGMYPHTNEQPVDLSRFPLLEGVIDVIYNPLNTYLIQQAKNLGIKYTNGFSMLVAQGIKASDIFLSRETDIEQINSYVKKTEKLFSPVCLIGMPGAGKTTIGKILAKKLNLTFEDSDNIIEQRENKTIPEIFRQKGEEYFRNIETKIIDEITATPNKVISPGGGAVLKKENRKLIKRNCTVIHIKRDVEKLSTEGRPLSENIKALKSMEKERLHIYESISDYTVENNGKIEETINKILSLTEVNK